jgi:hypothetical protein
MLIPYWYFNMQKYIFIGTFPYIGKKKHNDCYAGFDDDIGHRRDEAKKTADIFLRYSAVKKNQIIKKPYSSKSPVRT